MKTISAPTWLKDKKTGEIEYTVVKGKVALLYVGNIRYKFLLQETLTSEVFLTHYKSGLKLGSLTPIKLKYFKSYHRMKDRECAKLLIEQIVAKHGESTVQNRLNNAPVINT